VAVRLGDLVEPIEVLTSWARDHGEAIASFQEAAAVSQRFDLPLPVGCRLVVSRR
jgi:hypothetical protein